jgi:nucleoid-associated protein EbfC
MIKKLQKMQEDMKKAQSEINASTFYGQAGGSVVKVAVKGTKEVISIDIKKDEVDLSDWEMIQDMIVAALNDAFRKVDKEVEETMGSLTQGMRMPGMF